MNVNEIKAAVDAAREIVFDARALPYLERTEKSYLRAARALIALWEMMQTEETQEASDAVVNTSKVIDAMFTNHPPDSIIPRLFIGLHDSAGNEIYEGDVLIYCGEMFVVLYNKRRAKFTAFTNGSGPGGEYEVGVLLINEESKIIGNRYQPEFKGVFGDVQA